MHNEYSTKRYWGSLFLLSDETTSYGSDVPSPEQNFSDRYSAHLVIFIGVYGVVDTVLAFTALPDLPPGCHTCAALLLAAEVCR